MFLLIKLHVGCQVVILLPSLSLAVLLAQQALRLHKTPEPKAWVEWEWPVQRLHEQQNVDKHQCICSFQVLIVPAAP